MLSTKIWLLTILVLATIFATRVNGKDFYEDENEDEHGDAEEHEDEDEDDDEDTSAKETKSWRINGEYCTCTVTKKNPDNYMKTHKHVPTKFWRK